MCACIIFHSSSSMFRGRGGCPINFVLHTHGIILLTDSATRTATAPTCRYDCFSGRPTLMPQFPFSTVTSAEQEEGFRVISMLPCVPRIQSTQSPVVGGYPVGNDRSLVTARSVYLPTAMHSA